MSEEERAPPVEAERVLVIKHGAIGDFVLATGAMAAISDAHADAEITLLTTRPMLGLAETCPYFDALWLDDKPGWTRPFAWWSLLRQIARSRFTRIYDLQGSARTAAYFRFARRLGLRAEWVGAARGCSHPLPAAGRAPELHPLERVALLLAAAGIDEPPPPALPWLEADVVRFALAGRYVLLVPGGAPHRPEKRWPVDQYAALARSLTRRRAIPVVIGTAAEKALARDLVAGCQGARDLTGETTLAEVHALALGAAGAVGNDTGPMHLIAVAGAPAVVLFGGASDPRRSAPRAPNVAVLRRDPLSGLSVGEVEAALRLR